MAREFSVIVGIDASRARAGARQFKASANQISNSALRASRSLNTATKSSLAFITTLGRLRGVASLAFAGFLGVGGIGAVIRTLSNFGTAISKVEALLGTRGLGGAMSALENKARELGATTIFTATQAAEGMSFLTQAGFDALEVYQAIGPALNLAAAGALGLGEAADIVSNIMAGFNVEAEKTADVTDALAFVASRTNTSIRQLGEAMKFVAPVAGAVGLAVEDTAAALGILGNSGLQASLAGTSLRRVISGLLNPSKEANTVLGEMGLQAQDLVMTLGEENGLAKVVNILAEAGIGAAEAFTLFGQRGAPGLLSLVNQRGKLDGLNISMQDIKGTAENMAQVMADNLGGDARLAISALQEGILQLGEAGLTEWLRDTTQGFAGFIRGLTGTRINMLLASDAMKEGLASGQAFKENLVLLRSAAIALALVLTRNLIAGLALSIAQMAVAAANALGLFYAFTSTATGANLAAAGIFKFRAALLATGVGAIAVILGLLISYALASEDVVDVNEDMQGSMVDLSDAVALAAFNFDILTQAERELAAINIGKEIDRVTKELAKFKTAQINAEQASTRLLAAQTASDAANTRLAKSYDDGTRATNFYKVATKDTAGLLIKAAEAQENLTETQRIYGQVTLPEASAAVGQATRELAVLKDRQAIWNLILADSNLTLKEATALYHDYEQAMKEAEDQLIRETGLNVIQTKTLEGLIKKYDATAIAAAELAENYNTVATKLSFLVATGKGATASAEQLRRVLLQMNEDADEVARKGVAAAAKALQDLREKMDLIVVASSDVKTAHLEHINSLRALVLEMVLSKNFTEEQMIPVIEALNEAWEKNRKELEDTCESTTELKECMTDEAKAMETIWDQALRNIQDSFADAFRGAFDSFDDFADGLLDAFKDLLANMAAQAAATNLFGNGGGFFNDLLGGLSGGGSGGGGLLGSVASGGSGGSGLLGLLPEGVSSSISGALGSLAAGAQAFGQGALSFLTGGGNAAAQGLTTTYGGFGNVVSQTANVANPAAFNAGGTVAGAGIGAISGAVADAIFGGRGDPARNAIFSAIGGAIGSIFTPIGSVIGGAIGSLVDNVIGGAKKLERATITLSGSAESFLATQETVISKQKAFFGGKSRKTKTTNVNNQFTEVEDRLSSFVNGLVAAAESLGGASSLLTDFTFDIDINVKGKKAAVEARIAAAIDNLFRAAQANFVDGVEGLSERVMIVLNNFKGDLDSFGAAFEAIAGIENLFNLDLVVATTDAITAANKGLIDSYQDSLAAYREVVMEYDGSLESLTALRDATAIITQVQLDLVTVYRQLGTELSTLFQGSAQTIREALLNEEQLYALRKSQIDELVAQALNTTDPEELNRLAQEINRLGLDAFNLLDEDQRAALGPEFIEFFEMLDALFGDQIDLGIGGVQNDQAALDMEVAETMQNAADAQIVAAEAIQSAARELERESRTRGRRSDRQEIFA